MSCRSSEAFLSRRPTRVAAMATGLADITAPRHAACCADRSARLCLFGPGVGRGFRMKRIILALAAILTMGAAPAPSSPMLEPTPRPSPTPGAIRAIQERLDRIDRDAAAARQEQREIDDLAAQQAMVQLSKLQLWIGIVTTAVAATSVAFTIMALKQTNESLRIARTSAQAELRPYLGVTDFDPGEFTDGVKKGAVLRWRIENFGGSPASNVRVNVRTQILPGTPYHWEDTTVSDADWSRLRDIPPRAVISWFIAMDHFLLIERQGLASGTVSLMVCVIIVYDDCFGQEHIVTYSDIRHGKKLVRNRFNMGFKPAIIEPPAIM